MSETLRVPNEDDAKEIARLLSEGSPEPVGPDSVLRDWTFPGVQVELDARLGPGSYAFVDGFGDGRVWIELAGRPTTELLDWAELRAQELGSRFLSGGWMAEEPILRELERRGFALVRTSYRMAIDLGEPTPEPVWPDGVEARTFAPGDEEVFYNLHQEMLQGHLGADRGDVRRVGSPVPRTRGSGSRAVDLGGRRRGACRLCDVPPSCHGQRTRVGARPRGPQPVSRTRTRPSATTARVHAVSPRRHDASWARSRFGESDRSEQALRVGRDARLRTVRDPREERVVSSLRARCPNCRTFTAVAIGDGYECHSCGSTFPAGIVRVPAAWGSGGEAMAEGARIALPYPEVAVVERDTLEEQTAAVADALAARPIVVGGCCCTHVGACEVSHSESTASASSGSTLTAISTHPRRRRPEISGECRFA